MSQASRKELFIVKKCNFWFHKKCENPAEIIYKELLQNDQGASNYICTSCRSNSRNLLENLPFFSEINLDLPDTYDMDDEELIVPCDLNTNENYGLFKKRGLHFLHLNVNSILSKIDELRLIAHN